MVGNDVGGVLEPPPRELVEHLALERHPSDDAVERRQTIGGDEETSVVGEGVRHANLADAAIAERQLRAR